VPESGISVEDELPDTAERVDGTRVDGWHVTDRDAGLGAWPDADWETGPEADRRTGPGTEFDTERDTERGAEPGARTGIEPGAEPGTRTVIEPDARTGIEPGAEPGTRMGIEPGTRTVIEPGAEPGTRMGIEPGARTVIEPGARTGIESGARTGIEPGAEPGTGTGIEPGTGPVTELATWPPADLDAARRASAARGLRAVGRQLRNLLALALYGGVSLGLFGPWILDRMSTWFLSAQPQDGSLFLWAFNWWPFAISHHYSAMYSYAAWAPAGINLAWATTIPAPALALQSLTHSYGPMFSFNVAELAAPALASWTAYLLCRRLTRSFFPALIGGFFFGFSPSLIDEVGQGHPSLTLVFLVPLCAYLVVRLLEGSMHPLVYMQLLGVVLAAQFYVGDEIFATMTLVGGLCALIGFAAGPTARRRQLLRAIAPTAGAYAIAVILAIPLLSIAFTRPRIIKAIHFSTIQYGAKGTGDFLRYITPGRFTEHWGMFVTRWGDNPWYLGVPLIAVIILFAITEWRRRATRMLIAGLLLILLVSLGDELTVFGAKILPWRLFAAIPVLNIAQPGRLVTYAYLVIAVIVARWLARSSRPPEPPPEPSPYPPSSPLWRPTPLPRRSLRPLGWLPVLLAALTILPNYTTDVWAQHVPNLTFLASGAYKRYIKPGEIVWVLEVHPDRQLTWQAETGFYFRLSGGFFGGTPQGVPPSALQERLAIGQVGPAVTVTDIRNYVAAHHVGTIIATQVPWDVILKVRAAVGSNGMKQEHAIVFRLTDRSTGSPTRRTAWTGRTAGPGREQHRAH